MANANYRQTKDPGPCLVQRQLSAIGLCHKFQQPGLLKFAASLPPASLCRRLSTAGICRASHTATLPWQWRRQQQQPAMLGGSGMLQLQSRQSLPLMPACRSFVTLDKLHAWFIEGPEAAPPLSPPSEVPVTPPAETSSFFVEDTPEVFQELADAASSLAEPTFASLGLGTGLWPSSMALKMMESVHTVLDMPWWLCIVSMGIGVRILLFLPQMYNQRIIRVDIPKLRQLTIFKKQLDFYLQTGNTQGVKLISIKALEKFPEFSTTAGVRKFRTRLTASYLSLAFSFIFVQLASIRAIYNVTSLPVESFQQGGILWVNDLTCIDPYFLLPAAISGLLIFNLRQNFSNLSALNSKSNLMVQAKPLIFTLLPACVFTVALNFASAHQLFFLATGSAASLLHILNRTDLAKDFWKRTLGLPRIEDAPQLSEGLEELSEQINNSLAMLNNKKYEASKAPDESADAQVPKTYRIRRKHPPQKQQFEQSNRII